MLAVIIIVWVVGSFVMLFNYYLSHYVLFMTEKTVEDGIEMTRQSNDSWMVRPCITLAAEPL